MKAILDSSVAFKVVVPEEHSDKATSLMKEYRNGIHQLRASTFSLSSWPMLSPL